MTATPPASDAAGPRSDPAGNAAFPAWLETETSERLPLEGASGIGRSEDNQVRLPGEKVSRHHALIQSRDRVVYWLTDLGSSNGTFLNGRRVTEPSRLYDQDRISIGPWQVLFRQPGGRPRPAMDFSISQGTLSLQDPKSVACWMLLVDLGSLAEVARDIDVADVSKLTSAMLEACASVVQGRGGSINRYVGNGFLASWQGSASMAHAVAHALQDLQTLRAGSKLKFRFVLHHGEVTTGTGVSAEEKKIVGPEAGFVFRVDKLAANLGLATLISEPAALLLKAQLSLVEAGRHAVSGYPGDFAFYQLP